MFSIAWAALPLLAISYTGFPSAAPCLKAAAVGTVPSTGKSSASSSSRNWRSQKGGVGKTTFADEIAWGLERRGHKVGFGNLDPQGGANHEKNLLDDEDAVNVIDTPGFLSDDTAEYAKNADIAIIPVQPGTLGLKPMKRTIKVITEANPDLSFAIIVNNFAGNQTVDRQFLELLEADDLPVLGVGFDRFLIAI